MKAAAAFIILLFGVWRLPGQSPYLLPQEIEDRLQQDTMPWKDQVATWRYSFIGEYWKALEIWDTKRGGRRPMTASDSAYFDRFHPVEALQYISLAASGRQIVIINEAHHQPQHRVFTTQLLRALYQKGFRYLALEDLNYTDTLIGRRGYPLTGSGYYIVEPRLGNLVRQALAIGYTLWPYEWKDVGDRERGQARNLARLFEQDKQARVLVHCGFDHVIEGKHEYWDRAMAGWLKDITGIDPLTISQVQMTERSSPSRQDPHFEMHDLPYSAVYLDSLGRPFNGRQGKDQYDIELFHPRTSMVYGRPNWLTNDSDKAWVQVPRRKIRTGFPCLVEARLRSEGPDAIPVDVAVFDTGKEWPALALFPGKYTLRIRDGNNKVQELRLTVKK